MLDPGRCAGMRLEAEPHVSGQALLALKELWEEALEPARVFRQSVNSNHTASAYEKNRHQPTVHPSLFEPNPRQLQWASLPLAIRQQMTPLLLQLLNQHAARKWGFAQKGGGHE